MFRRKRARLGIALAFPLALLAGADLALAQSGALPPPPPIAVSQSEPGYGPLAEQRNALVTRQTAINKHRDDHNAVCLGIPASNTSQIAWCRSDVDAINQEKAAYAEQLKAYNAHQYRYQGQTLYLRKNFAGAIQAYQQAMQYGVQIDGLLPELYLAQAALANQNGDLETASKRMCDIGDYEASKPGWLHTQLVQLFGQVKARMKRYGKKFEVRTPTCVIAVRG